MSLNAEQPDPIHNDRPESWKLVIADMEERNAVGTEKYGTPLQPGNGRDSLVDAYQEALDLVVYLRTTIEERDAAPSLLLDEIERLRARESGRDEFSDTWVSHPTTDLRDSLPSVDGEPSTEAGKRLLKAANAVDDEGILSINVDFLRDRLLAIEKEARESVGGITERIDALRKAPAHRAGDCTTTWNDALDAVLAALGATSQTPNPLHFEPEPQVSLQAESVPREGEDR